MKRRTVVFLALGTAAALVIGLLVWLPTRVVTVGVARATRETLPIVVEAAGRIEADRQAAVHPAVAGTLTRVHVKDGQTVRAGAPLATLDPAPLRLQVQQAEAALAKARADSDAISRSVPSNLDRRAAKAQAAAGKAAFEAADLAYQEYRHLVELFHECGGAGPPPTPTATPTSDSTVCPTPPPGTPWPPTPATLAALRATRARAYALWVAARAVVRRLDQAADVRLAKAAAAKAIDTAVAGLEQARNTLSKATLRAPFAGTVLVNASGSLRPDGTPAPPEAGTAVSPALPVFTVVDPSRLRFVADVDEVDVARVRPGMEATIVLDSFPDESFYGTVSSRSPSAVTLRSGRSAFAVQVPLRSSKPGVLLGMTGSALFAVGVDQESLTIPTAALVDDSGQRFVFRISPDGRAARTRVEVGTMTDLRTQIVAGLVPGDLVATSRLTELADGMTVRAEGER